MCQQSERKKEERGYILGRFASVFCHFHPCKCAHNAFLTALASPTFIPSLPCSQEVVFVESGEVVLTSNLVGVLSSLSHSRHPIDIPLSYLHY